MLRSPIVVLGLAGVGKSTVGSALADRLGVSLLDNDDTFARECRMTPRAYADRYGIDALRKQECHLLRQALCLASTHSVIVAPGSALLLLRREDFAGCSVALVVCREDVRQARLRRGDHRPTGALRPSSAGDPLRRGRALAHTVVDTTHLAPVDAADAIVVALGIET